MLKFTAFAAKARAITEQHCVVPVISAAHGAPWRSFLCLFDTHRAKPRPAAASVDHLDAELVIRPSAT